MKTFASMAFFLFLFLPCTSTASENPIPQVCKDAFSQHKNKQFEEAVRGYTLCLETPGMDEKVRLHTYFQRGLALQDLGKPEKALKDLLLVLDRNPSDVNVLIAVSNAAVAAGQPALAEKSLLHIKSLMPDKGEPYMWLVLFYHEQNQLREALKYINDAIQRLPEQYSNIMWGLRRDMRRELGEHRRLAQDLTADIDTAKDKRTILRALMERAKTYKDACMLEDAIVDLLVLGEIYNEEEDENTLEDWESEYLEAGQPEKALEMYTIYISLLPEYHWGYSRRSSVYAVMGEHDKAKADNEIAHEKELQGMEIVFKAWAEGWERVMKIAEEDE